jgi:hypothetical protein
LETHILKNSYEIRTINKTEQKECYDLTISTFAFSELPRKIQLVYLKKVLLNSKHGYLIMNSGFNEAAFKGDFITIEELKHSFQDLKVELEEPRDSGRRVLYW